MRGPAPGRSQASGPRLPSGEGPQSGRGVVSYWVMRVETTRPLRGSAVQR